ncbi:MAG: GDP-L-fucose synthase [Gemmataceae bacterium]|nr:GDP-L-fucose synthase [Gemmataceae bacterium]
MSTATTYVAGHCGLVGAAMVRCLAKDATRRLIVRTRTELDLRDPASVERFFAEHRPVDVILAAAKVGGIHANVRYPVEFLLENLNIQNNVLSASHRHGVRKLLFLGSSCIYPRLSPQPIREDSFLDGKLEPTNEPYAIAKIAGITLARAYRKQHDCNFVAVMPTNLYGPFDNFAWDSSHVVPALIRKFCEAKDAGLDRITLWGTGAARREFLHADDLAEACKIVMERHDSADLINIGCGTDITIRELAELVADLVGWDGKICWDTTQPDGMPRKLLDISRIIALGWRTRINLRDGLRDTIAWFQQHRATWHRM